jgi:arsenate reductase (thioredoxin)
MPSPSYNVLFLCTGNSARSILAEAILNREGRGKFRAYSAGSHPKGDVNSRTLTLLSGLGYDVSGLASKSWNEFTKPGAPKFDFIFTVCDDAAGETCPVWPGKPATAHWGIADPAEVKGSDVEMARAFREAYRLLQRRIELFAALPFHTLDEISLTAKLHEIGRIEGATEKAKKT